MTHDNTNTQTFRKTSTYAMVVTALMATVTCILAPLSVPIGPVPISLTNFVIFLSPENQSLASKVGGIKSPEIMSLCLLVNFCHFVWPLR